MPAIQSTPLDPQTVAGQPRKRGGAPKNNTNSLKHGRRSNRTRFSQWRGISRQRPELSGVEGDCEALLCQLESAVVDARGSMTIEDASAADVAVGALFVTKLAFRHILAGGLSPDVELAFAKDALNAQKVRHEFITKLDLAKAGDDLDPWQAALTLPAPPSSTPAPPHDAAAVRTPGDASAGQCGVPSDGSDDAP